jgi:peptidoglycan/xylan/chitin deacetylase (PgdA/CDA1 family)
MYYFFKRAMSKLLSLHGNCKGGLLLLFFFGIPIVPFAVAEQPPPNITQPATTAIAEQLPPAQQMFSIDHTLLFVANEENSTPTLTATSPAFVELDTPGTTIQEETDPTIPLTTTTPTTQPIALFVQTTIGYYTPDSTSQSGVPIAQGTGYTITARYGWDWLQADVLHHGLLWLPADKLPTDEATMALLPNLAPHTPPLAFPTHMLQHGARVPHLPPNTQTYYTPTFAPGTEQPAAPIVALSTPYDVIARYGWDWVQVALPRMGIVWVYAPDVGLDQVDITPLPDLAPHADYRAYIVAEGDTLASIAQAGGSEPSIVSHYNFTQDPLVVGQPLIIPRLEGRVSTLPEIPLLVRKGNTTQPRVAITLDVEIGDVSQVLEMLRQRNTHATFFVTGGWAQSHPDLLRQIVVDGHELGNHSLSHPDFRRITDARIAWELAETERIVFEATGATTRPYFRPPYGGHDQRVLLAVIRQGYLPIYWTLDSQDAVGQPKTPNFMVDRMTQYTPRDQMPGMITLSHCCAKQHVLGEALWAILDRYATMGIEVRPLSAVLGQ